MPKDSILLHPKKGLNPRVTICRNCGESIGVALLGLADSVFTCDTCHMTVVDKRSKIKCPVDKCNGRLVFKEILSEYTKLPWDLCDKCKQDQDERNKVVAEGGVYFRCKDCHATGAIKPNEFTIRVRSHANIEPPKPVGVEFSKYDCPVCGPDPIDLPSKQKG